jgi:hypothetical protein
MLRIISFLNRRGLRIRPHNWKPKKGDTVLYGKRKLIFHGEYLDDSKSIAWLLGRVYETRKTIIIYGQVTKEVYPA